MKDQTKKSKPQSHKPDEEKTKRRPDEFDWIDTPIGRCHPDTYAAIFEGGNSTPFIRE